MDWLVANTGLNKCVCGILTSHTCEDRTQTDWVQGWNEVGCGSKVYIGSNAVAPLVEDN
jgi:hypothetical protein